MLFKTLQKLKERNGLTEELSQRIDVLYAAGKLTDEEYSILVG